MGFNQGMSIPAASAVAAESAPEAEAAEARATAAAADDENFMMGY